MAMIRRLAVLGGAAAAAAFFLKKRQESSDAAPGFAHDVGDAAAAGTGAAETMQETGGPKEATASEPAAVGDSAPEAPTPEPAESPSAESAESPAGDAGSQSTQVSAAIPDTSSDATVREQEDAAAAEAGAIGGDPGTPQSQEGIGVAEDPAMQPVQEGAGEEPETLEDSDRDRGINRERQG